MFFDVCPGFKASVIFAYAVLFVVQSELTKKKKYHLPNNRREGTLHLQALASLTEWVAIIISHLNRRGLKSHFYH